MVHRLRGPVIRRRWPCCARPVTTWVGRAPVDADPLVPACGRPAAEAPELWIAAPEPQIAFGRALGAAGQLKQARQAIVRALELLPSEAIAARVSPIADCAGMEHPLGHHESAHRRLTAALDLVRDAHPAEAVTLHESRARHAGTAGS